MHIPFSRICSPYGRTTSRFQGVVTNGFPPLLRLLETQCAGDNEEGIVEAEDEDGVPEVPPVKDSILDQSVFGAERQHFLMHSAQPERPQLRELPGAGAD